MARWSDRWRGPGALSGAWLALWLSACAPPAVRTPPALREAMVAAADPLAVAAGAQILEQGGSALDAAIATVLVLGLVEPESAGVGGGGFLLHYRASDATVDAYEGREWAPAGATPELFLQPDGEPLSFAEAQASGRSIGTPALIPMLALAHQAHGRLPWSTLVAPAVGLSEEGFLIGPRLARSLHDHRQALADDPMARALYLDAQGAPWPQGHRLRNPAYAHTLRQIAAQGPRALTHGPLAAAIVAAAQRPPRAGTLRLEDLAAYAPRQLSPLCAPFRAYRVCTAPPPSSANALLALLGLYARARPVPAGPDQVLDWSAYLWASRLAYVDRDHYMADDRHVETPTLALIHPDYLDQRARLIDLEQGRHSIPVGTPVDHRLRMHWGSDVMPERGTTHVSIVDGAGNAVALTASIESEYGAQRMVGGFWLNNQLTDFSFLPHIAGKPVANAVAPGKAPRSSMSPTLVLDGEQRLVLVSGSMGGSSIIASVARSLIGVLDWGLSPQEAVATPAVLARSNPIEVELQRMPPEHTAALRAQGWPIIEATMYGGTHLIQRTADGLRGGADPRLEGEARRVWVPAPVDPAAVPH